MTTTSQPPAAASEVTTIPGVIAKLDAIAKAHTSLAGGEGFDGSLETMEVGETDRQLAREAHELSAVAKAKWEQAAQAVREHNDPVGQAYSVSPGAGNKQANTNE